MKSGATETSYFYLQEHYSFPKNVFVSHLPEEIKKSDSQFKILWAHHAFDQQFFVNFDHHIVDHIVSPSQWNKDQFIKYHKVPENKITVIPNGVSEIFQYSSNKTKTFIHTSIPYKGLVLLPHIISLIHQKHPDAKFKIFSSMSLYGKIHDPYESLYETLKSLPNVEYHSAVDQEELVSQYQTSAFFIHPNIWEETFCVAMAEAMKCGCYPIITDLGALPEVATEKFSSIVPIDGNRTSVGYEVTEQFINNFVKACVTALDYFDRDRSQYNQVSKSGSHYIEQKCDWKIISREWEKLITKIIGDTMSESDSQQTQKNSNALSYNPISAEQAVSDNDYLMKAFENVLRWEESDKELAQGRTNFQIEKFIMLEQHTIPAAFENALKSRRQMAEAYMFKLIEMKERVRNFQYKWGNVEDKTKPMLWNNGASTENGGALCWYDLEELSLTHYLKSCELEIRDRLFQMEHLDKILEKLVEMNGGKPVSREQFLENDAVYWERRFADQAMDEIVAAQTGISIGNLHSMRRASAPSIVDPRNTLPEGYLPINKLIESPQGKMEFLNDLQKKVLLGIQDVTGEDLGLGLISGKNEQQKKLLGDD